MVKSGVGEAKFVTTVDELRAVPRHALQVLPPDDFEEVFEITEDVPTEEKAKEDGYWSIRIRTGLPEKFHFMAPVIVSIETNQTLEITSANIFLEHSILAQIYFQMTKI